MNKRRIVTLLGGVTKVPSVFLAAAPTAQVARTHTHNNMAMSTRPSSVRVKALGVMFVLFALFGPLLEAGPAGAAASVEQAAATWAKSQTGSTSYQLQCLRFVYQAYISSGFSRASLDANAIYVADGNSYPIDEWNYWMAGHLPTGQLHQGYDATPPAGAIIYFSNKLGHDFSHATISLGGGQQISPDSSAVSGPQSVNTNSYRTMLGWWLPDSSGSGGSSGSSTSAGVTFQANTGSLWTFGAAGTVDRALGMAPGTSPSIAAVPGGYEVAFQANTGSLWVTGALGTRDLGLGMAPGSSPSIAAVPGGYEVAFQANTGSLWVAGTQGTGDLRLGMARGTSPSIASCNGSYGIAFQANTGSLWTAGAAGTGDRGLGMKSSTSPSMACGSTGYGVAFQANTGSLWTFGAAGTADRGLGMAAGTSPSIAAGAGGFGVAFQANTGSLWTFGAAGTADRGLGMAAGTSPSIAGGSSYNVAFQANTGSLWTFGAAGTGDGRLGMKAGTSPSIA